MKIGFTGSRLGVTSPQEIALKQLYADEADELHHGDCRGADTDAHRIFSRAKKVIHPPEDPKYRAYCKGDVTMKPKPFLERNHCIVDSTDLLIACPNESREKLRSGTWATIRYARKTNRPYVIIIFPDGSRGA